MKFLEFTQREREILSTGRNGRRSAPGICFPSIDTQPASFYNDYYIHDIDCDYIIVQLFILIESAVKTKNPNYTNE